MRVNFGAYTYFNLNDRDQNTYDGTEQMQNKAYDSNYFDNLLRQHDYEAAADYAAQYHFSDPRVQREHELDIINIRRQGRILSSVYSKLKNDDPNWQSKRSNVKKVDFFQSVFENNGLEQLQDNYYADIFSAYKNNIGKGDNGEIATSLSITFNPKRTFLGWDSGRADRTEFSFETFLANGGFTEQELLEAGIKVVRNDSKTTITFNKSNPLANRLLYAMPDGTVTWDLLTWGETSSVENHAPTVVGYDANGRKIKSSNKNNLNSINSLKYYINDCKSAYQDAFGTFDGGIGEGIRYYSSTIGGSLIDGREELDAAYAAGQIDASYYNAQIKQMNNFIQETSSLLSAGAYEMYSNENNKDPNDERLVPVDSDRKGYITRMLSAADAKDIHMNAMICNGQIGTLFTIDAVQNENKNLNENSTAADMTKTRRYQVFVPGFLQEAAQSKIDSDSSIRAIQELDTMQDYGYEYRLTTDTKAVSGQDGTVTQQPKTLVYNGDGTYNYDGEIISKDRAAYILEKDMVLEQALSSLKYQFINTKDGVFNEEGYENAARQTAIYIANMLNPNVNLTNSNGQYINMSNISLSDIEYIFNKKGAGNIMKDSESTKVNVDEYDKYNEIFGIYSKLMSELLYYKK